AGEFVVVPADAPSPDGRRRDVPMARPLYLGEFPVTQAQFEAVAGRNPSRFLGDSDRPVEGVSWFAAQEFCLLLSERVGRRVRLPSEAEWEYACRAGTATEYHWGDEPDAGRVHCKVGAPRGVEPAVGTNVQGRCPPNAWGLFDLHGNVQEWCEDEWHDRYDGAPDDGSARMMAGDEDPFRVLRGGSCWH